MQRERQAHESGAGEQDAPAPDAVRDRAGDERDEPQHGGVHRDQTAERGVGDAELLLDAREDRRDQHELAAGGEDHQPEREQDGATARRKRRLLDGEPVGCARHDRTAQRRNW